MPSETKTPWAIKCLNHDKVFLTYEEYMFQLSRPDRFWECPICKDLAIWDDDNYENYLNEKKLK